MKFGEKSSYEIGEYVVTRRFGIGRVWALPPTPESQYSILLTTGSTGLATAPNLKPASATGIAHFERTLVDHPLVDEALEKINAHLASVAEAP